MEKVLVYGDSMLDVYTFGSVFRISPEAPVPEFATTGEQKLKLGGAANVAAILANLGLDVTLLTGLGLDQASQEFLDTLINFRDEGQKILRLEKIIISRTTVKERLIDEKSNQHVLRIADEVYEQQININALETRLIALHERHQFDKIFISDYDKGMLDSGVIQMFRHNFNMLPFIVDAKVKNFNFYGNVEIITPNHNEVAAVLRVQAEEVLKSPLQYGVELRNTLRIGSIAITLGKQGVALITDTLCDIIPAIEREVFDVTGAGDCFSAVVAYLWGRCSPHGCVRIANNVAGLAVEGFGNYIASITDVNMTASKLEIKIKSV